MRCFIELDLPEEIKEEILKVQKKLPEFEGKKTEKENLHLTLKFLRELSEEKIELVKERLKKIRFDNFEVNLKHMGFFDNQKYGVIWIHLSNCEGLQKLIDDNLHGLFDKEKRFMAHLTIARVKNIKNKKKFLQELKEIKVKERGFEVNEFKLKESKLKGNGPIYEDIEVCNLE